MQGAQEWVVDDAVYGSAFKARVRQRLVRPRAISTFPSIYVPASRQLR